MLHLNRNERVEGVQAGLAEWIEHLLLMLKVRGSNPAPSKNATSLPRSQVASRSELGASVTYHELGLKPGFNIKKRGLRVNNTGCCRHSFMKKRNINLNMQFLGKSESILDTVLCRLSVFL